MVAVYHHSSQSLETAKGSREGKCRAPKKESTCTTDSEFLSSKKGSPNLKRRPNSLVVMNPNRSQAPRQIHLRELVRTPTTLEGS